MTEKRNKFKKEKKTFLQTLAKNVQLQYMVLVYEVVFSILINVCQNIG